MFRKFFHRRNSKPDVTSLEEFSYTCACCGETHVGLPAFVQMHPVTYQDIPEEFRESHALRSDDLCQIDPYPGSGLEDAACFVRGIFEIPIIDHTDTVELGLWFSQSRESFNRFVESFEDDQSEFESFAWATPNAEHFREVGDTGFLVSTACRLIGGAKGQRPHGVVHDGQTTRLAHYQTNGMTTAEVISLMTDTLHPDL